MGCCWCSQPCSAPRGRRGRPGGSVSCIKGWIHTAPPIPLPTSPFCPMDMGPRKAEEWCRTGAAGYCSAELTHPNPPTSLFKEQWSLTQLPCLCYKSTFCYFINEDKIICSWAGKRLFFLFCSEVLCQQRPNYVVRS